MEPRPPALGAWSLSPWTTREVPCSLLFRQSQGRCLPGPPTRDWTQPRAVKAPSPKQWLLLFNCVRLSVTPRTTARQAPLSMGFPRQAPWSGLPLDSQAIPQCLCRPQDRVYMPKFAFAGPRQLGLPGPRHSEPSGLRRAPRPPLPPSLRPDGLAVLILCVPPSVVTHRSTRGRAFPGPATHHPALVTAPPRCDVCVHTPLPNRPWMGAVSLKVTPTSSLQARFGPRASFVWPG